MNAVAEIMGEIKSQINILIPDQKEIPFLYSMDENDSQMDKVFGVRVGTASIASGVNRHLTFDQEFIVDLTRKHIPKKAQGDKDLRDKILLIHSDIQAIYRSLSHRSISIPSGKVLLITPVDISSPSSENGIVTVSLTLQVQYRVSI